MTHLIINNVDITERLSEKLTQPKLGEMCLLQVPADEAAAVNIESLKILQRQGYEGIYITLNIEYNEIVEQMTSQGVDVDKLTFIDGVSKLHGVKQTPGPHIHYIDGPLSLGTLIQTIETLEASFATDKKFIMLDSLSVISIYNSPEKTLEFTRLLHNILQDHQLFGVGVSVEGGLANIKLSEDLATSADKIIQLN